VIDNMVKSHELLTFDAFEDHAGLWKGFTVVETLEVVVVSAIGFLVKYSGHTGSSSGRNPPQCIFLNFG